MPREGPVPLWYQSTNLKAELEKIITVKYATHAVAKKKPKKGLLFGAA